jgi:hypothetical protein
MTFIKKPCVENEWLKQSPVRLGLLAPFVGITRIRFKGFVYDVSAIAAPPLYWRG